MEPRHQVTDPAKVTRIAESLERDGYQGAPLVRWGDSLITGTHRYAALRRLGWQDNEVPVVDLEDLYQAAGLDFAALWQDYSQPTIDDAQAVEALLRELPLALRASYGIEAGN